MHVTSHEQSSRIVGIVSSCPCIAKVAIKRIQHNRQYDTYNRREALHTVQFIYISLLLSKFPEAPSDPVPNSSTNNKASLPPSRIAQLRLIKWLLTSSSHLGRALAELFGLLVHQCVAPQSRIRRHLVGQNVASMPSLPARLVAEQLTKVLIQGLSWVCPEDISIPRLR